MTTKASRPTRARSVTRIVFVTLCATVVGAFGGFVLGANIGGNWMTSLSLGSLHGYELTALIGTVTGAIMAAGAALLVQRSRR